MADFAVIEQDSIGLLQHDAAAIVGICRIEMIRRSGLVFVVEDVVFIIGFIVRFSGFIDFLLEARLLDSSKL